jgi:hypothetical protein
MATFVCLEYVTSDDMTIDELEKISNGVGRGLIKLMFRNLPESTEETRETG